VKVKISTEGRVRTKTAASGIDQRAEPRKTRERARAVPVRKSPGHDIDPSSVAAHVKCERHVAKVVSERGERLAAEGVRK
jgi:hypothetical protein